MEEEVNGLGVLADKMMVDVVREEVTAVSDTEEEGTFSFL